MNILLVNPTCRDPRITDADDRVVPIGLYYIAAQLLDAGHGVEILNLAAADIPDPIPAFAAAISRTGPELIGFSVTCATRFSAMDCAALAKNHLPGVTVIFGGPGATFMAGHLFAACPALDMIVAGEGEQTCLTMVRALSEPSATATLDAIPGLIFRRGTQIVSTGPAPPVADLDTLVHPSRYFVFQHLAMSRGCSGTCTFCGSPKFWGTGRVRYHSPEWFVSEILALARNGVTHFYISDDTFTRDRDRVIQVCRRILDAGVSLTWNAISRVDCVDANLLTWMRRAGCIQISFGVESGSPAIRRTLGKPVTNDQIRDAFRLTASHGILPRAYFIYGSIGETSETIQESVDLMMAVRPLSAVFYLLTLFPGTRLYDRAEAQGHLAAHSAWIEDSEDLPAFALDPDLDFNLVSAFGQTLRHAFYHNLPEFARDMELVDDPLLYACHSDFLSRLAMTFSHGEYAQDPRIPGADGVAKALYEKALRWHPDARAYLGLAMILQKDRQMTSAIQILDEGLGHFPGTKDLVLCRGICLMNLGLFADARDCLTPFHHLPDVRHYRDICHRKLEHPYPHD